MAPSITNICCKMKATLMFFVCGLSRTLGQGEAKLTGSRHVGEVVYGHLQLVGKGVGKPE